MTRHSNGFFRRNAGRIFLAAATLAVPAAFCGCNILGPALYLVEGPAKVPQLYELDAKKVAVVFVDDRDNQLPRRVLRQAIGEATTTALLNEKVVETMIDSKTALAATLGEKAGKPVSIVDIGRRIKDDTRNLAVDQLIYVSINHFTLSPDGQAFAPEASVFVKVMDVTEGKRLWPEPEDPSPANPGYLLQVRPPKPPRTLPSSLSEVAQAQGEFAKVVGTAVAQLFYEATVNDSARTLSK